MAKIGVESRADQAVADRGQAVRAFGMVRPHVVQQERRVRDVSGGHGVCFDGSGDKAGEPCPERVTPNGERTPTGGV